MVFSMNVLKKKVGKIKKRLKRKKRAVNKKRFYIYALNSN